MPRLLSLALAGLCLALTACFVSDQPLIVSGEALPAEPARFCTGPTEPCHDALRTEDGYLILPSAEAGDEEGPVMARFITLTIAGGHPVWLGEIQLESGNAERIYMLARQAGLADDGAALYDLVLPDCGETSADERSRLGVTGEETGGVCRITNLDGFAAYLTDHYGADFADPDWWRSGS